MPLFLDDTGIYGNTTKTLPAPAPLGFVLSGSSVMQVGNGTAVAPSIAFTNSPTSGMFRKAADSVGFSAAGTEIGSFTTAGAWILGSNVGVSVIHTVRSGASTALDITANGSNQLVQLNLRPTGSAAAEIINRTLGSPTLFYSSGVAIADRIAGSFSAAGDWTFGASNATQTILQSINGTLQVRSGNVAGNTHAFLGSSANNFPALTYNARPTGTTLVYDRIGTDTASLIILGAGSTAGSAFEFHAFASAAPGTMTLAAGSQIGQVNIAGAWTLGPTAGAVNQTVRGFLQAATDGVTDGYFAPFTATRPGASTGPHIALVQRGVYAWGIGINHASNALQFGAIINANSYTDFGNCSSGAAWTLGNFSSVGASLTHAFRSGTETRLLIDSTGAAQAAYLQFGAKGGSPAVFEKTGTGSYLWRNGAGISLLTIADSGLANFSGIPAANESIIASGKIRSSQIPNTTRASGTFTTNGSGTVTLSLVGWSWGNFLSYDRCMLVTVAVVSAANQEVLGQVYLSVGPGMSLISERKQKGSVTWSATFSFGNDGNAGSRFFVLAGAIANTVYTYEISGLSFRHDLQGEI